MALGSNFPSCLSLLSNYTNETLSTHSSVRSVQRKLTTFQSELEKRHFPSQHNKPSKPTYKPHGRRFIPHGHSEEEKFRPHAQKIKPKLTELKNEDLRSKSYRQAHRSGPDWKSRLRYVPSPHNPDYPAPENWPEPWKGMRTFPAKSKKTYTEASFYPDLSGSTKRTVFDGVHKSSLVSQNEINHTMLYGRGRREWMIEKRNGIPQASPGDKNYQAVEYSPHFHKAGSTLPVVNFGGSTNPKPDTFVPLMQPNLHTTPRESYWMKEKHRQHNHEVREVEGLEQWRPATPLIQTIPNLAEQSSCKA